MDWHTKEGWGGYSFDTRLFPIPSASMARLKGRGLAVGVNLHDDDGVRSTEDMYLPMCQAMGLNPNTEGTIPFSIVNWSYVQPLEDIVLQVLAQFTHSM